jgi:rubredoxin
MERPEVCPECGSDEIAPEVRMSSLHGRIHVVVCGACSWISDPRLGRPPADRSKNVTLRRMLAGRPARRSTGAPR